MSVPDSWLLSVGVQVDPSVEDDWNRWYDDVHLPEIVKCPGFKSGSRFRSTGDGPRSYLTIYELDRPDAMETDEFATARGWDRFADKVTPTVTSYELISRVTGADDE